MSAEQGVVALMVDHLHPEPLPEGHPGAAGTPEVVATFQIEFPTDPGLDDRHVASKLSYAVGRVLTRATRKLEPSLAWRLLYELSGRVVWMDRPPDLVHPEKSATGALDRLTMIELFHDLIGLDLVVLIEHAKKVLEPLGDDEGFVTWERARQADA